MFGLDFGKSRFPFLLMERVKHLYLLGFEHREYARTLSFEKCFRMHWSTSQMDVWSPSSDHSSCMVRFPAGLMFYDLPNRWHAKGLAPSPHSLPPPLGRKKSLGECP